MSPNKRYINEEGIRQIVKENGLEYLINFIKKPEILIIEDGFSSKICNLVIDEFDEKGVLIKLTELGLHGN